MNNTGGAEEKLLLPLPKWKIWFIMVIIFILLFFDFANRIVVGPLLPLIKKEFGLLDSQLGLINTVVLIVVTILAMPLSYVIDRWRRGKMVSLMAILWSIGSLICGWANSFGMLLTGRGVLGVAEASYNSTGQTYIMATIKKKYRTTVTGFLYTGMTLGIAGGMALGGWLGQAYGWRTTLLILAVPGIVFGLLAWFMPDYKNPPKPANVTTASLGIGQTLKVFFQNKSVLMLVIAYALINFSSYTSMTWLPTYLIRFEGMNMAMAGSMTAIVMVVGIIGSPVGGWLGDLVARKNTRGKIMLIALSALLNVVATIVALPFDFWPMFILASVGTYLLIPPQQVALQELVPAHQRASVFGFYYAGVFILGGLWSPYVIGAISDASNLKVAFWVGAGVAAVSLIFYLLVYKFFNSDYARARQHELDAAA